MVSFEAKVKGLCRANNTTQKQLYESIGVTDAGMRKMYLRNSCEVAVLEKIAAFFNVSPCYFFDDDKQTATANGDRAIAINNNSGNVATGDTSVFQERVAMLERILEEKERTIQLLLKAAK